MTPQFEAALAAIRPLSIGERQQLIQFLIQETLPPIAQTDFQALSASFWQGKTIEQLLAEQKPVTVNTLEDIAGVFWPKDESDEEFLAFLRSQRNEIA